MDYTAIGNTGVKIPRIVFGTSALGNLYRIHSFDTKLKIVSECISNVQNPVFDTAGKYGAGLALETLGQCLDKLKIRPDEVLISNKLGWLRKELTGPEPDFEKGVWFGLKNDAVQQIGYDGIMACFDQGNELLGATYKPQLLSVHDPDEYIGKGKNPEEKDALLKDIIDAYRALSDLKKQGKIKATGIGSKDWKVISRVTEYVDLDWVMLANSLTIMNHPPQLVAFIEKLAGKGVTIINSAVFHGGFLTGSSYYDYRLVTPETDGPKFRWREEFYSICRKHDVMPSVACVNFGLTPPGVAAISLNTSNPDRVKDNVESVLAKVPEKFYCEMVKEGLISKDYPWLGI